jgi:catechol 2,3-dioxygenase
MSAKPGQAADAPAAGESIHPNTTIGAIRLTVADLDREQAFYEQTIGLRTLDRAGDAVSLGADGATPLVELVRRPDAPRRALGTTGLFHLAILVPSRLELARALRRVADTGWRLTGASDHLVSEALYLRDAEGNGIEIYRDRPRGEWRHVDGGVQMDTLPLELDDVLGELAGTDAEPSGMPPATRIGHVHLQVADLAAGEAFYHGTLGFEVTVRGYPGALFLSAGGYHHHIGLNTWAGEGAPAPAPGSTGLRWFEVVLPGIPELEQVARRAGVEARRERDGIHLNDPSGNGVLLRAAAAAGADG